jgi:hypothetical protein
MHFYWLKFAFCSDFLSFYLIVLFVFQNIKDTTLYLVYMSSEAPLTGTISQIFLVFDDFDCCEVQRLGIL